MGKNSIHRYINMNIMEKSIYLYRSLIMKNLLRQEVEQMIIIQAKR